MEYTQREMLELAGIILMILLGGVAAAILIARTSVSRREARHRRVSAARRAQNTSYDLFTAREKPADGTRSGSRKRRRRKSHSPQFMIDLLRHEEGDSADGESPGGAPKADPGSA
jgi:hypothetical protein